MERLFSLLRKVSFTLIHFLPSIMYMLYKLFKGDAHPFEIILYLEYTKENTLKEILNESLHYLNWFTDITYCSDC